MGQTYYLTPTNSLPSNELASTSELTLIELYLKIQLFFFFFYIKELLEE